jgi:ABC-type Fe3+/spermidine/putrescine transport system ATPase subunit
LPSEALAVRGLTVSWSGTPVLNAIDLTVGAGEFVTLMGPNGSGKTTLLRTIAGFERPDGGEVRVDGVEVTSVPPHRRGVGLVFQESTMLPGRTVWENVAFAPELQRRPTEEVERTVGAMLDLLHLRPFAERSALALSGGERQRVALARCLAARPRVILLDEPFASVDAELRAELRAEFRAVLRAVGASVLHVTHDREEGLFLGDRVVLLDEGRIVQTGVPSDVFRHPSSASVARFLGYNLRADGRQTLAVHPADIELGAEPPGLPAHVIGAGPIGRGWVAYVDVDGTARWECRGADPDPCPTAGDRRWVRWRASVTLPEREVNDLPSGGVPPP